MACPLIPAGYFLVSHNGEAINGDYVLRLQLGATGATSGQTAFCEANGGVIKIVPVKTRGDGTDVRGHGAQRLFELRELPGRLEWLRNQHSENP